MDGSEALVYVLVTIFFVFLIAQFVGGFNNLILLLILAAIGYAAWKLAVYLYRKDEELRSKREAERRDRESRRQYEEGQRLVAEEWAKFQRSLLAPDLETRFSHTHIIGPNRAGKTTLLKRLILTDLLSEEAPALVIVDAHNDLIDFVARLDLPRLKDKLILITPRDIQHPPAINIFAFNEERYRRYSELEREQAATAAIDTLDYLFGGLGIDLTGHQGVLFEYSARLLFTLPRAIGRNAVLQDLIDLMADREPPWFSSAVSLLSSGQRDFFDHDYKHPTYRLRKQEVRNRLVGLKQSPTLERLFGSQKNVLDFFDLLNDGAVILIDTADGFLKGDSPLYGKVFISRVLQAASERDAIPLDKRKPAFLYVDEAQKYFDANTKEMLTDLRKFKLGCVFAHHDLEECGASLRAALMTEPAIRMAGRVSPADARVLAEAMHTDPDFIRNQPRYHFATYIDGITTQGAASVSVPITELNEQPRLSDPAYEEMRQRNRERVSGGQQRQQQRSSQPPPRQEQQPRHERPGLGAPVIDTTEDDGTYRI